MRDSRIAAKPYSTSQTSSTDMSLKDQKALQSLDAFPMTFDHRVIYADMDSFQHVNNGAIGRYFEEGRAAINLSIFGPDCFATAKGGSQLLFASVTIDYLRQCHYPGNVTIASGVGRIGNSSWSVMQAGFQNGQCFAVASAAMVKALNGKSTPLSDDERASLASILLRDSG